MERRDVKMIENWLTDAGQQRLQELYLEYMSSEYDEIYMVPERIRSRHRWATDEAWDHVLGECFSESIYT